MTERNWKKAFEPGFDPEDPFYPQRMDLSQKQKGWLVRAWTWASTGLLGMSVPTVPDAIPRYSEKKGFHYVSAIKLNQHHIIPVGESLRLDGQTEYNVPRNVAPVSVRLHTGDGVREGDDDEELVIHKDTMEARRNYGIWAKKGKKGLNPMQDMHLDRKHLTDKGQIYHDDSFDRHFQDLADRVTSGYVAAHPEDKFPDKPKKRRGRKVITNVWCEEQGCWVETVTYE